MKSTSMEGSIKALLAMYRGQEEKMLKYLAKLKRSKEEKGKETRGISRNPLSVTMMSRRFLGGIQRNWNTRQTLGLLHGWQRALEMRMTMTTATTCRATWSWRYNRKTHSSLGEVIGALVEGGGNVTK